jgi:pyrimidine-nucleoside phosphorylase
MSKCDEFRATGRLTGRRRIFCGDGRGDVSIEILRFAQDDSVARCVVGDRERAKVATRMRASLTVVAANVRLASLSNRMRAVDLIRKKRDSGEHTRDEIAYLVSGYTKGDIPDYQMAAWLMAVWIRGLSHAEIGALTEVMLHSGEVVNHSEIAAKKVDKHSTGGVGDKTSLILAPIVAAGGLAVPMISGRGLGHTGGTLDKLEAIPGFNTALTLADFRRVLRECGMSLIGQTAEIAPADKKIYGLRDVTSTVENIGLICASIMSKKLAEGIDALVLDVKTGSGAFMSKEEDAVRLAEIMVDTARRMGKKCVALLTDMNQPLGRMAGHSSEVIESIDVLKGGGPEDLRELSLELSAWMFYLGERTKSVEQGRRLAEEMISSGKALERFRECIRLQGGDARVIDDTSLLPMVKRHVEVTSPKSGYIRATHCRDFGVALAMLEGGREKKEDRIDHGVGLEFHKRIGDRVQTGEKLVTIQYNSEAKIAEARKLVESSFVFGDAAPPKPPLVHRVIGG